MFVHNRVPDFAPGRMRTSANQNWSSGVLEYSITPLRGYLSLYVANNSLGFIVPPVNHQPARTLRNPATKENDNESQCCADSKCESPSKPDRNVARIEQQERGGGAHRSADPI